MSLPLHLRRQLEHKLMDFHGERIREEAKDIVYEGISFKGLKDYTDKELLEDYAFIFDCDSSADIYTEDELYQACLAELSIEELVK